MTTRINLPYPVSVNLVKVNLPPPAKGYLLPRPGYGKESGHNPRPQTKLAATGHQGATWGGVASSLMGF